MAKFAISGVGPCSPFSYVQSLAGQGYSQDGTGPNVPDPNADLWSASTTGNEAVIGDDPAICNFNTDLAGGDARDNPEPSLTYQGCAYDWIETQCTGNQTWPTTDGVGRDMGLPGPYRWSDNVGWLCHHSRLVLSTPINLYTGTNRRRPLSHHRTSH